MHACMHVCYSRSDGAVSLHVYVDMYVGMHVYTCMSRDMYVYMHVYTCMSLTYGGVLFETFSSPESLHVWFTCMYIRAHIRTCMCIYVHVCDSRGGGLDGGASSP